MSLNRLAFPQGGCVSYRIINKFKRVKKGILKPLQPWGSERSLCVPGSGLETHPPPPPHTRLPGMVFVIVSRCGFRVSCSPGLASDLRALSKDWPHVAPLGVATR